ncbi:FAD-dependent monooxygenase [Streptomyces oryzae]|uniref:FAD-dependent monooxygenase n=1 Tax=Streptomyces oryzae TaxID=1434886 RepID=A0ABS3XGS9_9ACTN|nr:FAD-dependent monooxygenase [Streptomyces oryzae]MBO8194591.1 FAD-dependent monooxygenase [Streptomyces oryzae]
MVNEEVVVAGGGPVGLMLAAELRLAGVSVTVLEREPAPRSLPMVRGIHARTLETLECRGLLEEFRSRGRTQNRAHYAGMWLLDLTDLPTRHAYSLGIEQGHVIDILSRRAEGLGARILPGHEVSSVVQDDHGVTAGVNGPGGSHSLRCRFLIGCDGGRSLVRSQAGIGFPGSAPSVTGLIAAATVSPPDALPTGWHRLSGGVLVNGGGPSALADHTIGTFEFDRTPTDRGVAPTADEVRHSIRRVTGSEVTIDVLHWIIRFTDNTRQADRYRLGRVLVAGDAAHVHFPAGGQGLNLGLQDAVNLGWKLAAVVRGHATTELLDTYHRERHPVAARVLDNTRAQIQLMRPGHDTDTLRDVVAALASTRQGGRRLAEQITGLDITCPVPTETPHPLVGRYVPHLTLGTAAQPTSPAELLRTGRFLLIDLADRGDRRALARRWGDRLTTVSATPPEEADHAADAILVRPDGYIAWATDTPENEPGSFSRALTTWAGPPGTP